MNSAALPLVLLGDPNLACMRRYQSCLGMSDSSGKNKAVRHKIVHVVGAWGYITQQALDLTLGRVAAMIVTPLGPPVEPPWWHRRVHRMVFPSQIAAREWSAAGWAMGRMAVAAPGVARAPDGGGIAWTQPTLAIPGQVPVAPSRASILVCDPSDAMDPSWIVEAAAAGAAIVSTEAHEELPPGAVIGEPTQMVAELLADPVRRGKLGHLAQDWVAAHRQPAQERAALLAVYEEAARMAGLSWPREIG